MVGCNIELKMLYAFCYIIKKKRFLIYCKIFCTLF